jgi:hypothetical protein
MSTKAQLIARIAELEAKYAALSASYEQERTSHDAAVVHIAALEAKLVVARTCYKELRASIHVVDTVPAAIQPVANKPIVSRFTDALGRVWIKTRVGNRATSVLAA